MFHDTSINNDYRLLKSVTFIVLAFILTLLPLPNILRWIWPNWILLLVIYKVIIRPRQYSIYFSLVMGLTVDLLMGNKLGVHGLAFSLITYFLLKMQQRVHLFPVIQQGILIFFLLLLDSLSIMIFNSVKLNWMFIGHSVLSAISTAVIWIMIVAIYGLRPHLSRI